MPRVRVHNTVDNFFREQSHERDRRRESLRELDQLKNQLSIEQDSLETACIKQPDLLYQVAEQIALHRSRRDAAKKELEEREAVLYIELRRAAAVSEERVTEAEIKAQMTTKREHQVLTDKLAEANELLSRWEVLKEAFSQRSYMLKELVSLYLARYYGDPARSAENRMRDFASERTREARRESAHQSRFRNGGDD